MKNDNEMILMRMRGVPARPATPEELACSQNPKLTLPPELLPTTDGPADVFVKTNDGKLRLVHSSDR